jgi:hypothetical protein
MRRAGGLLLVALIGCGGSATPPPQAPANQPGQGAPRDGEDAITGDAEAPGAPLDENECAQLADHLVDLSLAVKRGKPAGAGNEPYTDEDAEAAKRELRQSLRPACATLPRRDFRCAMTARTSAELGACQK